MAVNAGRFEELLGILLDGEPTAAEDDELADLVRADPARRRELRQQLALWDLWSQQCVPERAAEAFVAACRTRRRAEHEDGQFVAKLNARIRRREGDCETPWRASWRALAPTWARFASALQPPGRWISATAAAVGLIVVFWWLALPHPTQAMPVTLHGEVVCTACMLHETPDHAPALVVHDGNRTLIYYVQSDRRPIFRLGDYCSAPLPLVATGRVETSHGRLEFNADTVALERIPARPAAQPGDPALFPF